MTDPQTDPQPDPQAQRGSVNAVRPSSLQRARGVLLGGAVGDALGAPVEFLRSPAELVRVLGDRPPSRLPETRITDDTQMTLFTAEALIRSNLRGFLKGISSLESMTYHSYLRWYLTQGHDLPAHSPEVRSGWLIEQQELWSRRAPGNTCLSALGSGRSGKVDDPINDSMGCGGVMRTAPIGLMYAPPFAFDHGCINAALTHGHRNGIVPAGALAMLISYLDNGETLEHGLTQIIRRSDDHSMGVETAEILTKARRLAANGPFSPEHLTATLGEGWVGHEALAIAVACVVANPDPATAMWAAALHPGDSDSTASIAGQIIGAMHGIDAIPSGWIEGLELVEVITTMADTLDAIREGTADRKALAEAFPGY